MSLFEGLVKKTMIISGYIHFVKRCYPWLIFGVLTVFFGNFGQSFFISWFGASFQQSLGLSSTEYGSAYSLATLVSGLLIMWVGGAIDRIKLTHFVTFCTVGLFVSTVVLSSSTSLIQLTIGLFLLRFFGQGLLPHTAITTMMKKFTINRGKAISIATTGVPLGEMILPAIGVLMIGALGWQTSWVCIGLLTLFFYLPVAHFLIHQSKNDKYNESVEIAVKAKDEEAGGSRANLLHDYRFWLAIPGILAPPFIVTGIFIHQGFILSQMGWTPLLFAGCFVFYGISHWLSSMYSGALVDKFSGVRLLRYILVPIILGLFTPVIFYGEWVAYALMTLLGVSIGACSPVINALWAEIYGTKYLGAIRALITSLMVISTALSPILFGYLIDNGISGQSLFFGLSVYAALAMFLFQFSYKIKKGIVVIMT